MSDAAVPNPIPPLDASPEITATAAEIIAAWQRGENDGGGTIAALEELANKQAALLRRLGEREAGMRGLRQFVEALALGDLRALADVRGAALAALGGIADAG